MHGKACCTYLPYLIPLLARHSTAWSRENSQFMASPSARREGWNVQWHSNFLVYCSRDWFLSHLTLGTLTGKVVALLDARGPAENKGNPPWLAIAPETAILHKDTRGSSWIEIGQPLQLGNYTHKPRGNTPTEKVWENPKISRQVDWWKYFTVQKLIHKE